MAKIAVGLIWLICLFFLHSFLLIHDPVLIFDDQNLIYPLLKVASVNDYFMLVKSGAILDLQPVRDLSFLINIHLNKLLGFSTFHWGNFILLLLILWQINKLLKIFNISEKNRIIIIFIMSLHPIFGFSVAWISARKHLLSLFFILIASRNYLEKKNVGIVLGWFILSLLSQPIHLFWPLALYCFDKFRNEKPIIKKIAVLSSVSFLTLITNYWLYSNLNEKGNYLFQDKVINGLWSIGRSMIQILIPYSFPASYFEGSILNMLGLLLVALIFIAGMKKMGFKKMFFASIIFYYCLIPTATFFIYTPYLLMMAIILISFGIINFPDRLKLIFAIYLGSFSIFTLINLMPMWRSDKNLWEYSYKIEGGPKNTIHFAQEIVLDNPDYALELALSIYKNYNWYSEALPTLIGKSLHRAKALSVDQKLKIFADIGIEDPWFKYFWASTFLQARNYQQGTEMLYSLLQSKLTFGKERPQVLQEYYKVCQNIPNLSCKAID